MEVTKNRNNSALAGEFAVLSRLHLHGLDASLSLGNTKSFDIFVHNQKIKKVFRIEVKTSTSQKGYVKQGNFGEHMFWRLGNDILKNEENISTIIYCFVRFPHSKETKYPIDYPLIYVVPAYKVIDYLKKARTISIKKGTTTDLYMRIGTQKNSDLHLYQEDYINNFEIFEK